MRAEDEEEQALLHALFEKAKQFLISHEWCFGVGEAYFGDGIGGVIGIFLLELAPVSDNVDQWLWVIVGDIPSAYLVVDECPTPVEALETYIELMREWVALAYEGKASPEVFPVVAAPTPEHAEMLDGRLKTFENWIETESLGRRSH
ncbi:hypothetical protein HDF16_003212 [Granulicella aggregans]|uniref:Uncharacterized protein n=2 Tax=Granulicella aggregans TaxID=474949 RepID=A0A7W7ZF07_9BACT|nr:hypothetical protein [Granulicella aggregans]